MEVEMRLADPPDGGWGWVVVFCSFMIHVIADGVTYTFGIFYMEFLKYFGESRGTTSWVASIMVGTTFCIGPLASGLTNKFGCRVVTIIGSLLATFGLIMSTMAPNVVYLFFSIGLCTGAGFGLMYLPAIVCVTCYFEKRRAFATGIAVCGSGIGTFILAPITEWLVNELGWKGAMLILSGLVLNCCVFGALFRPLDKVAVSRRPTVCSATSDTVLNNAVVANGFRKSSLPNGTLGSNGNVSFTPSKSQTLVYSKSALGINHAPTNIHKTQNHRHSSITLGFMSSMNLSTMTLNPKRSNSLAAGALCRKDIFYSGNLTAAESINNFRSPSFNIQPSTEAQLTTKKNKNVFKIVYNCLCPPEMKEAFVQMMDFRLMKDVIFLMFGFSNFFTNIGFNVPFVYTADRAVGMNIANETYASYLLSTIGIANTIGRVILGYLSDRKWVNRLWLYNGSLTLCGLSTVFSALCHDYTLMSLYAVTFGATAGAYVSLTSVILVDLLGLEKLTNAFGLLLVFEGVACLIGPPITGWLSDCTGSYDPGFYLSGGMIAISGLMLFFIPCVRRTLNKKIDRQNSINENARPHLEITVPNNSVKFNSNTTQV